MDGKPNALKRALTKEEHVARAMLLGAEYDEATNIYRQKAVTHQGNSTHWDIDADTLAPVSPMELNARLVEHFFRKNQRDVANRTRRKGNAADK